MFEAILVTPIRISITSLGFRTIEKQLIASAVFGLLVYFGIIYQLTPMCLREATYDEALILLKEHPNTDIANSGHQTWLESDTKSVDRRISQETFERLRAIGYRQTVCYLDATSIALVPVAILAAFVFFRVLRAAELAIEDVRAGKTQKYPSKTSINLFRKLNKASVSIINRLIAITASIVIGAFMVSLFPFPTTYCLMLLTPEASYEQALKTIKEKPKARIFYEDRIPTLKVKSEEFGLRVSSETAERLNKLGVGEVAVCGVTGVVFADYLLFFFIFLITLCVQCSATLASWSQSFRKFLCNN